MINYTIDSPGSKKLSYYTYKKMVEILDGSDWDNILTIIENNGIYVYRFTTHGKPVWVAWNDKSADRTITLDVGNIDTVRIIRSIPRYKAGKKVTDYSAAFETKKDCKSNQWKGEFEPR